MESAPLLLGPYLLKEAEIDTSDTEVDVLLPCGCWATESS